MAEDLKKSTVEIKENTTQNTVESKPVVSETIPIPEPKHPPPGFAQPEVLQKNHNSIIYSLEELRGWGEHPTCQEFKGQLPNEIDRKNLGGALRKRGQPNQNGQRWKEKQTTRGEWQQRKNVAQKRGDEGNGDDTPDIEEERILDNEQADKNEAAPQWDGNDEEDIKHSSFEFKVLDRDRDRKIFQETGKVPDEAKFMTRQAYERAAKEKQERFEMQQKISMEKMEKEQRQKKTLDGSGALDHLFRAAAQSENLPPVPKDGVKGETLEKSVSGPTNPEDGFPSSFYAHPPPDHREPQQPPTGSNGPSPRDPAEELSRPMDERYRQGAHLGDIPFFGAGVDPKHSPSREANKGMFPPPNTLPSPNQRPYDPNRMPSPHQQPVGQSPLNHPTNSNKPPTPGGNNVSPMSRLDTILYEVTSPVRPCVGGAFFAHVRPLSNKELYDYSPKFKEIQDSKKMQRNETRIKRREHGHGPEKIRQKFMSRHGHGMPPMESDSMSEVQMRALYHRKRMVMQKYAHAKKMHTEYTHLPKYPPHADRYGGHAVEYGGRSLAHGVEYRRRERPEYDVHYEMMRSNRRV